MDFERAGVIGAGTMGVGIGYVLALSGARVWLVEPDERQTSRAARALQERADLAVLDGSPTVPSADLVARVEWRSSVADLPLELDVIVEAVPERFDLKQGVLAAAQDRDPRLLGSNTSGLSIGSLASALQNPSALVGLHFFNPVWAMRLLEVVQGPATAEKSVRLALLLAAQLDKEPIVVADTPGFATSRLGLALGLEAMRMVEDGVASIADIDKAMVLGYRHPMGPLRLTDLVGLDVRLAIATNLTEAFGVRFAPPTILLDKVARGELGQKTGIGFYRWPTAPQPAA
jgi:3-hydroxybutyryl-CoA dehydrogenase